MDIHIRRVVEQDYEVFCKLFNEVNELHRLARPDIFRQPVGAIMEQEFFLDLITDEKAAIFFAESAGRPAGFVTVVVRETPDNPVLVSRRYAVVDTLAVRPAFHRTGVGRALMQRAEEWAASQGVNVVELNVHEFNQGAQAFYQRLGYTTLTRRMSKKLA